jgi:hypothetical protein
VSPTVQAAFLAQEVQVVHSQQLYCLLVAATQMELLVGGVPQVDVLAQPFQVLSFTAATNVVDMRPERPYKMVGHYIYKMYVGHISLGQQWGVVAGNLAKTVQVGQV